MTIPVYDNEAKAGLADAIRSSGSIAYVSKAIAPSSKDEFKKVFEDTILAKLEHPKLAKANDKDQWDLFWINSILVSVGWNNNDDVFDPGETWAARHTPVHKQFNFMHDEKDIIGSMTASIVLDSEGKIIPDDIETVPNVFDIVVASVLYTQWSDPELQERMDKIVAGIQNNEWFVSMECLFRNFDYAIVTPEGEHKIVARTNASSFLTKHLRVYGGTGEFEGHRIGRLLRKFTYSGKGLVDSPANPKSIIFGDSVDPFVATADTNVLFRENSIDSNEDYKMSDDNVNIQLKEELVKASARSDKLEAKLGDMVAEAQKAERDKFEGVIASLEVDVEDLEKKVEANVVDVKTKNETVAGLEKQLKEANAKISELEIQVSEAEAKEVKATRISQLVEAGVSSEDASELADRWASSTNEQFSDVVELHKVQSNFDKDEDRDKKKKDKDGSKATDDNEDSAKANLDDVEEEEDMAHAASDEDEGEALRSTASSWIAGLLSSNNDSNE